MPTSQSLVQSSRHAFKIIYTIALVVLISLTLSICVVSANELSLFSETEPFTVHIPIRIGLVGFNSSSVFVDPKPLLRSLGHTLRSYTPINLDTGRPFNVQYRYIWDVYHVAETIQVELEQTLSTAIKPTLDTAGKIIYSNNPRKVNMFDQTIPLSQDELNSIQTDQKSIGSTSPLYEIDISQIDLQLSDIVYKALSTHLKLRTFKSNPQQYLQTKKGADKEYSIFIMNLRRDKVMENYIKLTQDKSNIHANKNDYIYGYTTRKMSEVIDARRNIGVDGSGHFGAYSYTNTWIASGRVIFADLQAISSVGTTLDRADYFLEELLSNIYKNMNQISASSHQTQQQQQQHQQNEQSIEQPTSYGVDLLHSGLISWRYQQNEKNELDTYYNENQAGKVIKTSRANSIVPSMFDTSSLSSISTNPSGISTLAQYGMGRSVQHVGRGGEPSPSKHQIGARITPLLSSFIASATKQGLTTDISTPSQQIPFFGRADDSEHTSKQYIEALQQTVLTVPILLLTDHSYNLQLSDIIDMPIIEKMLAKLSLSKTVKVIPLLHNIHTLPAVSTALFSSLDSVQFNSQPGSFYPGQSQRTILNGDIVSAALLKTSHANPILASIVPPSADTAFSDIISRYSDSFKKTKQRAVGTHETIPVFVFSLIALPQDTTIIYPSHINPESTSTSPSSSSSISNQKSYILHLHNIHSTKNAQLSHKERLTATLRKELTLKVLDSLITRLTGTIAPYLKYKLNDLSTQSGLTSPHLITNPDPSSIAIDTRSADQRGLYQQDELLRFRKEQMSNLLSNTPGKALSQYIDSTWALGLHPFGPYSTMYKYTKLYRDAAKRNVLINTLSDLISTTWKTIHNTCSFISGYGFLMSNLKPGYVSQADVSSAANAKQQQYQQSSEHSWNDAVGYVKEQGLLESQLNCILYFTEGYFTPEGVSFDEKGDVIISDDNENKDRGGEREDNSHKGYNKMLYAMKRKHVKSWLSENNIKIDSRMLDYLAIHPNAPIYVLQQLGWFIESLSLVDRQLNILQQTLNNNINFSKTNKHSNYHDYWTDVYTQLYLLIDKVAILSDVSQIVTINVKQSYASCRVVQSIKGENDYSGFGLGDSSSTSDTAASSIHNIKYQSGGSTTGRSSSSTSETTKTSALNTSTIKSTHSMFKLIMFCLFIAVVVIIIILTFVVSCLDICGGNNSS